MEYSRIITTEYGLVRGIVKDGCEQYLGIPFAEPPVGDLAFKHPIPPKPWKSVLEAYRAPINPVQGRGSSTIAYDGKDCLYLNVFVPQDLEPGAPVMVWICGGSYANGGCGRIGEDTDELFYDPALIAKDSKCIVVSINFRLNFEGFLYLNSINREFDSNNGLYDQIAALRFVRNNIHRFGGDADNVTVFGQSSGAACIIALMGIPEARTLFDRAILQSACAISFWNEDDAKAIALKYLKLLGIKPTEMNKLKDVSIDDIHTANNKLRSFVFSKGSSNCAFSPVIDGKTIKGRPVDLAKDCRKPVLVGTCSHEGDAYICNIPTLALPFAAKRFGFYFRPGKGCRRKMSDRFTYDFYKGPVYELAREIKASSWVYEYQYLTPNMEKNGTGCFHACELPVLFGKSNSRVIIDDPVSRRVGEKMRELWGEFAHSGKLPWEQYKDNEEIYPIK